MKKIYNYDEITKTAIFKICENGHVFIGKAKPAPEDFKTAGKLTGLTIAEYKAKIAREQYKQKRWYEKQKRYEALMQDAKAQTVWHTRRANELNQKLESYKKQKDNFKRRFNTIKEKNSRFYGDSI